MVFALQFPDTATDEQKALMVDLYQEGYSHFTINSRGVCGIARMLFTVGIFYGLDHFGYTGRYCYKGLEEAIWSLGDWNGVTDPPGNWIKHKGLAIDTENPNYKKP
jgi:hypothetical protein